MGKKSRDYFGVGLMPKDGNPGTPGPMPYPVGVYDSAREYIRTQNQAPVVMDSNGNYYLLEKFGVTKGVDPVTDTTGTWTLFDHFQYVFADIILANFANLGGGIHYNNALMSQMGVKNGQVNSNYQEYTGATGAWQPNILLDWLTGLIKAKKLEAEGGKIGDLEIEDGKLKSSYSVSKGIWNYSKFPPEWMGEQTVQGSMEISVDAVELNEVFNYQGIPSTTNTRITPDGVNVKSTTGLFFETKSELVDGRLSIEFTNRQTGDSSKVEIFSDGIYFNGQKFTGSSGGYVLPIASATTLGGVKVGTNLSISNGVLSATNTQYNVATTSANGLMSSSDKSKLNGIAALANNYVHPSTHPASMITAGTLQGIVKANNNTSYTTKQVRNMILSTGNAVASSMENGDIWIKYE